MIIRIQVQTYNSDNKWKELRSWGMETTLIFVKLCWSFCWCSKIYPFLSLAILFIILEEILTQEDFFFWKSSKCQNLMHACVQSCLTLCDLMDCSPPGSSVHGIFPGKNIGVGCHFFLQEIFLTQGLNQGLPHCRQMLYCWNHQVGFQTRYQNHAPLHWEQAV